MQDRLQAMKPDHFLLRAFVPAATLEQAYVLEKQGIAWHKAVIYTYIQEALAPYWK
ncbi:MAG: Unknown protein [uncultured Thiotrichaceae bacterium]|uniref:Uncharacterized protein n=1 Tax=uncultured Thiotrichaceae bacterium TaxID=298394 RepID=A0A6S6TVG1_9GAMM|nr:MAG: Unknown protein [uncultured Thiotrichaceae bacterium]